MKTVRGYMNMRRDTVRGMITLACGHRATFLLCALQINIYNFLSQNQWVRCSLIHFGSITTGPMNKCNLF